LITVCFITTKLTKMTRLIVQQVRNSRVSYIIKSQEGEQKSKDLHENVSLFII